MNVKVKSGKKRYATDDMNLYISSNEVRLYCS